jgi:hypothetical protein
MHLVLQSMFQVVICQREMIDIGPAVISASPVFVHAWMILRCLHPNYDFAPQAAGSGSGEDLSVSEIEGVRTEGDFPEWASCHTVRSMIAYHQGYCQAIGNPLQSEAGMKESSRDEKLVGCPHVRPHDLDLYRIDERNAESELLSSVSGCHRTENGQQIQEIEAGKQQTLTVH